MSGDPTAAAISALEQDYEIVREIGRGGTALVYLACERSTGADVAIKLIRAKYIEDEETLARFAREARYVGGLNHPNVVALRSVVELGDLGLALVMDHVRGPTLKQMIQENGPLPPGLAESVLRDIASALGAAHALGIVHRDVKPENIFIDTDGRALLADFGVARSMTSDTQLTMSGIAIGTPAYMAPEQIDGIPLDGRGDIYSLGLVGWEMLTGKRPWEGASLYAVIYQQKHEYLPDVRDMRSGVPDHLATVISGAIEKDREARWQSADEFIAALDGRVARRAAPQTPALTEQTRRFVRPAATAAATGTAATAGTPVTTAAAATVPTAVVPVTPATREAAVAAATGPTTVTAATAVTAVTALTSAAVATAARAATAAAPVTAAFRELSARARLSEFTDRVMAVPRRRRLMAGGGAGAGVALVGVMLVVSALHTDVGARAPGEEVVGVPAAAALLPSNPSGRLSGEAAPRLGAADSSQPGILFADEADDTRDGSADLPSANPGTAGASQDDAEVPDRAVAVTADKTSPSRDTARSAPGDPAAGAVAATTASPPPSPSPSPRVSIATGGAHTCLVMASGRAYCWGGNDRGQLGSGSTTRHASPSAVGGDLRFAAVAPGLSHSCAISRDGAAWCWGENDHGQLGDRSRTARLSPVPVADNHTFRSVEAGAAHTCGLDRSGKVWCWGSNARGQLGTGDAESAVPVTISTDRRFTSIALGWSFSCALDAAGRVMCWGENASGQLGNGTREDRRTPTAVRSDVQFVAITAGSGHACGLTAAGEAYCWGRNTRGQLGDGTRADQSVPVRVKTPVRFTSVSAGAVHTCAVASDGSAYCWGQNTYGQLGDGGTTDRMEPAPVVRDHVFAVVRAFGSHTCGATVSGEAFCWGYNLDGQLGDGTRVHRTRPVYVEPPSGQ